MTTLYPFVTQVIESIFILALVLLIPILSGLGIFKIIRFRSWEYEILVAPAVSIVFFGILSALTVIFGCPIVKVSPYLWILMSALALMGLLRLISDFPSRTIQSILAFSFLSTLFLGMGYILYGPFDYLGSPALDGWSYISFGQYLDKYARFTEGGLAPIYQYASHLSGTRFVASSLLALLIPPVDLAIDTQMTAGPLLLISIFSYCLSLGYIALVLQMNNLSISPYLTIFFGGVGGWIFYGLHLNNFDNLLVLPFYPLFFGVLLDKTLSYTKQIGISSIFLSAIIFIYPEMMVLMYGIMLALLLERLINKNLKKDEASFRALLKQFLIVSILASVITLPYLLEVFQFFINQLGIANQQFGRPGENSIPGLLNGWMGMTLFWGLQPNLFGLIGVVTLSALGVWGVYISLAKGLYSLIFYFVILAILFAFMICFQKYDYGAYKILIIGWWVIAILTSLGFQVVLNYFGSFPYRIIQYAASVIMGTFLCGLLFIWVYQNYQRIENYPIKVSKEFRKINSFLSKNNSSVFVDLSNLSLNIWATYFLRDAKVAYSSFLGYMDQPHTKLLMIRSKTFDKNAIQYVLTESANLDINEKILVGSELKVLKVSAGKARVKIDFLAPNGLENLEGNDFFWLGKKSAMIFLTSNKAQEIQLKFETFVGPSTDGIHFPQILIKLNDIQLKEFESSNANSYIINIPLRAGKNSLEFQTKYTNEIMANPNGDQRILFAAIKILKWSFIDSN